MAVKTDAQVEVASASRYTFQRERCRIPLLIGRTCSAWPLVVQVSTCFVAFLVTQSQQRIRESESKAQGEGDSRDWHPRLNGFVVSVVGVHAVWAHRDLYLLAFSVFERRPHGPMFY